MTPQEILRELRDIHLPEAEAAIGSSAFVLWPFLLVLLAGSVIAVLIWLRRSIWRRDVLHSLNQIEASAKSGKLQEAWASLALLMRRLAIQRRGRDQIAKLSGEPWLQQLDQLMGGDLFTRGAGRGLISYPYESHLYDHPDQTAGLDELETIVDQLREQLQLLRMIR